MNMTIIKFNAFDRDSSATFSERAEVDGLFDAVAQHKEFEKRVPFMRFYFEPEFIEGDESLFNDLEAEVT